MPRISTTAPPAVSLPDASLVNSAETWSLPTEDGLASITFYGRLLGLTTTQRPRHTHVGDHAEPKVKCGACRWFAPRIFREILTDRDTKDRPGRFLIHYAGMTTVPGESDRSRYVWVEGAHAVIEQLTTRNWPGRVEPFMTAPAARVLAQAASFDTELEAAYVNRAVV